MRAEVFLLGGLDGPDWMDLGACADDDALFLGATVADQVAVCQRCPVRSDCLAHAVDNDERFGVWGGRVFGPWLAPRR